MGFALFCIHWHALILIFMFVLQIVLTPTSIPFLSCHLINVESIVQVKRALPIFPKWPWAIQIQCFPNQKREHRVIVGCETRHSAHTYLFLFLSWDVRMERLDVLCAWGVPVCLGRGSFARHIGYCLPSLEVIYFFKELCSLLFVRVPVYWRFRIKRKKKLGIS